VINNLMYYPGICLRQANRSLGRDSNPGPIEHEAGILPTLPPPSVFKLQTNYSRLNGSKQFPNLICYSFVMDMLLSFTLILISQ
jgi:hypothetical protein